MTAHPLSVILTRRYPSLTASGRPIYKHLFGVDWPWLPVRLPLDYLLDPTLDPYSLPILGT